jgi:hypothetical protein
MRSLIDIFEDIDVEKTTGNFGEALKKRIAIDPSSGDHRYGMPGTDWRPQRYIRYFMEFDPTTNKQYTLWMIRKYLGKMVYDEFEGEKIPEYGIKRLEDLGRVKSALQLFDKFKSKLPIRDIGKIASLYDLEELVEPYHNARTKNEIDADYVNAMKKQSRIITDNEEFSIVVPMTQEASCYFGRNTRWCTASREDNMFDSYNSKGSLYIILLKKENRRYQFSFATHQYMDEKDEEIIPWVFSYNNLAVIEALKTHMTDINKLEFGIAEDGLVIDGDFDMRRYKIEELPNKMVVNGMFYCNVNLPNGLRVNGTLCCTHSRMNKIGNDVYVHGNALLDYCTSLAEIGNNFRIAGILLMKGTPCRLPPDAEIGDLVGAFRPLRTPR